MKREEKIKKILLIISLVVLGLGIILGILTYCGLKYNFEANNPATNGLEILVYLFGSFILCVIMIYVISKTIGTIGVTWGVYGLIKLFKKGKNGRLITMIIMAVFLVFFIIGVIIDKDQNYKYRLHYNNSIDWYEVYVYDDKVKVKIEEDLGCKQTNCSPNTINFALDFSDVNTKKVNDFIENLFENKSYNSINIVIEQLDSNQEKIFYAIIYNDESYLNN